MSRGDHADSRPVKPLIAYYVFCVTGRPVAGGSVAHVNRGLTQQISV